MDIMSYYYEVFESLPRCGPGENESTRRAFNMMSDLPAEPKVLDIGCGPGVQTLELARCVGGHIIALDNHQPFLNKLVQTALDEGLEGHITTQNQSMLEMDFDDESFDVIWSEGALYFMGFENGLKRCRGLLKPRGWMAVTEVVYLKPGLPAELQAFWNREYPDIRDVPGKIRQIGEAGFDLIWHFTLPKSAWLDHYYQPMQKVLTQFGDKYHDQSEVIEVLNEFQLEIDLYKRYSDYYGYEFFIMRKV